MGLYTIFIELATIIRHIKQADTIPKIHNENLQHFPALRLRTKWQIQSARLFCQTSFTQCRPTLVQNLGHFIATCHVTATNQSSYMSRGIVRSVRYILPFWSKCKTDNGNGMPKWSEYTALRDMLYTLIPNMWIKNSSNMPKLPFLLFFSIAMHSLHIVLFAWDAD